MQSFWPSRFFYIVRSILFFKSIFSIAILACERLLFLSIGKDSVRSRTGRLLSSKCRKCQCPRDLIPLSAVPRHHGSQTSRPPSSRPRLPMEPEKAPWSSSSSSARRRDRSRSPGAAPAPRDPYDYIRRTRIKADDWDTYWDNFPQSETGGTTTFNNNNNNNTVHRNNNNNSPADSAVSKGRATRQLDKLNPTADERSTIRETKEQVLQGGGKPPAGMLAMEDESLEPEVKPIAEEAAEAGRDSPGRKKTCSRKEAAASRLSAQSSEFADLVAMKSHLPSAEFRYCKLYRE